MATAETKKLTVSQRQKILEGIRKKNGGILRAEDVVAVAKATDHPLHDDFEWDDSVAGHEYRLWQARQMIRIVVVHEPKIDKQVRVYVSLDSERTNRDGGGYRRMDDVLSADALREQLILQAKRDFDVFRSKYHVLKELCAAIEQLDSAIDEAAKKVK